MTTIIVLIVITAVFSGVFYGMRSLWQRFKSKPIDYHELLNPGADATVVDREARSNRFADLVSEHNGDVPLRPLLLMSSVAMVVAVAAGFAFLNLSYHAAPVYQVRSLSHDNDAMAAPKVALPKVVRSDFVDNPKVRVIVDDSDPDLPPVEDLLHRCTPLEITYVDKNGTVKCYSEGSANAQKLLDRTRNASHEIHQQGLGTVITAATTEVAKEVAERKPGDRYAELVYFVLTFMGVFLRFCWEAAQSKRRTKRSLYFTPQTLITSLVLAIATYAMIIQSGLAGNSDLLSFKTGIFAVYNGLLSTGLLKDLGTLRPGTTAPPVAPAT